MAQRIPALDELILNIKLCYYKCVCLKMYYTMPRCDHLLDWKLWQWHLDLTIVSVKTWNSRCFLCEQRPLLLLVSELLWDEMINLMINAKALIWTLRKLYFPYYNCLSWFKGALSCKHTIGKNKCCTEVICFIALLFSIPSYDIQALTHSWDYR